VIFSLLKGVFHRDWNDVLDFRRNCQHWVRGMIPSKKYEKCPYANIAPKLLDSFF
jgi:hypothetical protein